MIEDTATPETGPVDAPVNSDPMSDVLEELGAGNTEKTDAADEVAAALVKETEDDGHSDEEPGAEESETEPTDDAEEAEEAPPEEAETADDPSYTVKVNGEEVEVPLSELLKGYSRTEDYKAKTMALADERRQVESQRATIEQDVRGQYAENLQQALDTFEALDPVLSEARQIDWERLKAQDPATFVQLSDAVQQRLQLIGEHRAKLEQINKERATQAQRQQQAEREQRLNAAAEAIIKERPELAEGDNFSRFATDNVQSLIRDYGFTPDEVNEAIDDRILRLIDDARYGRSLRQAKATLPEKKVVPKSAVKPLKSDASDAPRSSRRLPPKSNREGRVSYVIDELLKAQE